MSIYVNGEPMDLLEDRRFALYHRFPEGVILVDPGYFPPKAVPLSALPEEHGVTACKLMPFGHYYAYLVDPVTGERKVAATSPPKYLIVHNLPPHTTPEMLGKFFESYDFVVEADVFKSPGPPASGSGQHHGPTICKGRGYVQFNNAGTVEGILSQTKSLMFFDQFIIYLESADRVPKSSPSSSSGLGSGGSGVPPPPQYQAPFPSSQSFADPRGAPSYDPNRRLGHHHHHMHHGPPPAPGAIAMASNNFYFVTQIYEEHIQTSVRDGIFWPTKLNQKAFYSALERGPVFLIFMLVQRATLFGYARLTPRDMVRNKHANFTLEWVRHNIYLVEKDLKVLPDVNLLTVPDGTLLKSDFGDVVCELCDKFSARKMPDDVPYVAPPPPQHGVSRPVPPRGGGFVPPAAPRSMPPQFHHHQQQQQQQQQLAPTPHSSSMIAAPRSVAMSRPIGFDAPNHHQHHHQHHHHHHHHLGYQMVDAQRH